MSFEHVALQLKQDKKLVYTAMSKKLFFFRMHISKFVLEQNAVPLNPFMIFDYFLTDTVNRDVVREANNNIVMKADELWVFGDVSDGVLSEIKIAKAMNKPIKYFVVVNSKDITSISVNEVVMEEKVKEYKNELPAY